MDDTLRDALATVEPFAQFNSEDLAVERLGGLTNINYRVNSPVGDFVLRLAGEGTSDYIDRAAEEKNAQVASNAGVNAEIVFFDAKTGTMVTRYIENAVTLNVEKFKDKGVLQRAGRAFRQLHDSPQLFEGEFELFEQIDQYLAVLNQLNADLPDGYSDVHDSAKSVRAALSSHPLPKRPCHCDPMVENCIDDGDRVFIIDFEYAGNNDPMWDLGDLAVEGAFSPEQEHIFMSAYFGQEPEPFDVGRMVM
ncbi:MAG: phosphotransferase, partial [Gammaproteobacteria bacterium]|nr:phosphotransferase [Gammaproteobacteria bacterium]